MTPQQGPDATIHYHPVCLLDVLAEIPLDATEANIWRKLAPPDRRSLRQACQRSRQLADELVQSAAFDIHYSPSPAPQPAEGEEEEQVDPPPDAASLEAWQQAVEVRAAYLARLPRLRSLELNSWSSEADLLVALLHLGGAAHSSAGVTRLELCGDNLSLPSGCALRVAFPRLQELTLRNKLPVNHEESLDLTGAIFLPLRDLPLTKLVVDNRNNPQIANYMSPASLRSLLNLRHLRHLSLIVTWVGCTQLQALSSLTELTHLSLKVRKDASPIQGRGSFTLHDCAGLLTLPHLTFLRLPYLLGNAPPPTADVAPPHAMRALSRLQSLHFDSEYVMRDAVFAEVAQLTQLSMLKCGGLALACPTPGHLPALQHLQLDDCMRPQELLQALLPLLPLPSLTALDSTVHRLCVDVRDDGVSTSSITAVMRASALARVSRHLATAPRLHLRTLTLMGPAMHAGMPYALVVEALRPLGAQLTQLHCYHFILDDGAGWSALSAALPRLSRLTLSRGSTATGRGLTAVCKLFSGLQRLDCDSVAGLATSAESPPPAGAESWARDALLVLAAARSQPLLVVLYPPPAADVVAECRAVQQLAHGRQNIVWGARARYCSDDVYTVL